MSESNEKYDINESFPILMRTCSKLLREGLNQRFRDAGFSVTAEQWAFLVRLSDRDGVSQQSLADSFDRSKVAALKIIEKLEKQKLVLRRPAPEDRRIKQVFLTPKGRSLLSSLIPRAKENVAHARRGLSDSDIEMLKEILRKIIRNTKS